MQVYLTTLQRLWTTALAQLRPPPKLTISEWADAKRRLPQESSPEPGQWRTDRFPPLRGIMDAMGDPDNHEIAIKKSAQVGVSECLINKVGYHVDLDPCPMMYLNPTLDMAEAFSKDRLQPLLRETPDVGNKVDQSKDTESTLLQKRFPGGHLTMAGANSPSSLAARPIRVLLGDDIDRFPVSAGEEGDPVALGTKRTNNFYNWQVILASTPTNEYGSRIHRAYLAGDQRRFFVACPGCGAEQVLEWANLKWDEGKPDTAHMACVVNGCVINESDKYEMLLKASQRPDKGWRATNPGAPRVSFHISELYSPWRTWSQIVEAFLEAKKDPETLRVWVNTVLGEVWKETLEEEVATPNELIERREEYKEPPEGVLVVVGAIDVQDDRLECEIRGFGQRLETWGLQVRVLWGNPAQRDVWQQAFDYFDDARFTTADGRALVVRGVGIDTGGHHTKAVYAFCGANRRARVRYFALKGVGGIGQPTVGKPRVQGMQRVPVFPVGTNTIKDALFARLKVEEPGPGYLHWPMSYDAEYFDQLLSERVAKRYRHGVEYREYVKRSEGARNEALDLLVYGYAVVDILNLNLSRVARRVAAAKEQSGQRPPAREPEPVEQEPAAIEVDDGEVRDLTTDSAETRQPPRVRKRRGGWMRGLT